MSNVPQTPNFKLFQPTFDRKAWHQYVNKNFSIIDAVLTTYLDVGNIVGVWENSTSYNEGDRVIDPVVGQVFEAASDHTSAASPTTFAEDRDANPTYWTSLAVTARGLGAWAPGTLYQPNDFVVNGTIYAVCIATHTSTGVFADDAAFWDYLIDISTLPTLPSTTGKSLDLLRVKADESGAEWADEASIIAWLGLGSAAFTAASDYATAGHTHNVGALSGSIVIGQVPDDLITFAKIQNITDARLLGRSAGSAGDMQHITVGSGLTLTGGALTGFTCSAMRVYTANDTWNKPANLHSVLVVVVGGGASGAGSSSAGAGSRSVGQSGAAGGAAIKRILAAALGSSETVIVGAGGAAPSAGLNNGNNGNSSSFGAHCSATGGAAGVAQQITSNSIRALCTQGGIGSGGDINIAGGNGNPGWADTSSNAAVVSGNGGDSIYGAGGVGVGNGTAAGNPGRGPGAGGSGATTAVSGANQAGGAGADGVVVVCEFTTA